MLTSIIGCQQDSKGASIVGVVKAKGNAVPGAIVRASRCWVSEKDEPTCATYRTKTVGAGERAGEYRIARLPPGSYLLEAQQEDSSGYFAIKYSEEGVEVQGSDVFTRNIEIPTGVPPQFDSGPSGYVFAGGAENETQIYLALVSSGIRITDWKKVVISETRIDGTFYIKYREGTRVFTRIGELHEIVWKVTLPDGRIVYVEKACGNVVLPIEKIEVLVVTATPVPSVPTCTPTPTCVPGPSVVPTYTPEPTSTPVAGPTCTPVPSVPTCTPTPTCVPGSTTRTPVPTSTPQPTSTPTQARLDVTLHAVPNNPEPSQRVDLKVVVVSPASELYTIRVKCTTDGPWGAARSGTGSSEYVFVRECSYEKEGVYSAWTEVSRGGERVEGNANVNVTAPTPTPVATAIPTSTPTQVRLDVILGVEPDTGVVPFASTLKATASWAAGKNATCTFSCGNGSPEKTLQSTTGSCSTQCNFSASGSFGTSVRVYVPGVGEAGGTAGVIAQ